MNKNDVKTKYRYSEMKFIFLLFIEIWTQLALCKVRESFTLHETYCVHTSNENYFLNIYIATDFSYINLF